MTRSKERVVKSKEVEFCSTSYRLDAIRFERKTFIFEVYVKTVEGTWKRLVRSDKHHVAHEINALELAKRWVTMYTSTHAKHVGAGITERKSV